VTVTFLVDGAGNPPRVAYAVGRKVGPAVVRNQVRRRLRAAVAELHQGPVGPLPPGAYLVGAGPSAAAMPLSELKASLSRAMHEVSTP
jgi:ribonuclease P protein component